VCRLVPHAMHKDDIPNLFHPASVEVSERKRLHRGRGAVAPAAPHACYPLKLMKALVLDGEVDRAYLPDA
jgi:hypothetical protein